MGLQGNLVAAQSDQATSDRWTETAYGISLTPPKGSRLVEQPSNGAVASWVLDEAKVTINIDLVHSDQQVDLNTALNAAQVELSFADNTTRVIFIGQRRIADRPGALGIYAIEGNQTDDWLYSHAIMMIDPTTMAVFTMDAPLGLTDTARQWFVDVLDSVTMPFAFELNAMRSKQIEAGDVWLKSVTQDKLQNALPGELWFRMVEGGEDVGYMRCRWMHDDAALTGQGLQAPGVLALVDRREKIGSHIVDTQLRSYVSADGVDEVWSKKSSVRGEMELSGHQRLPDISGHSHDASHTWVESGVRGNELTPINTHGDRSRPRNFQAGANSTNVITVTRESPPDEQIVQDIKTHERFGSKREQSTRRPEVAKWLGLDKPERRVITGSVTKRQWATPGVAFASQVHTWALPFLMPRDAPDMSFYTYYFGTGSLSLTTSRVAKESDGGWTVYIRPSPRSGETATRFSRDGKLVQQRKPNGVVLEPVEKSELDRIWNIKK